MFSIWDMAFYLTLIQIMLSHGRSVHKYSPAIISSHSRGCNYESIKYFSGNCFARFNAAIQAETIKAGKPVDIIVYRSPSCTCCEKWLEHLKKNNFSVKDIVTDDIQAIKNKYGVSPEMASCHTP